MNAMKWDEWVSLLTKVIDQIRVSYTPDILVPSMNGGLVPCGIISAKLGIKDVRPVSIGRKGEERYFLYPFKGDIGDIKDKKILIIEDDIPTGKGMYMARDHFKNIGVKEVEIACVFKGLGVEGINFFHTEMNPQLFPIYPWKVTNLGNR